jgi:hypothetical protein
LQFKPDKLEEAAGAVRLNGSFAYKERIAMKIRLICALTLIVLAVMAVNLWASDPVGVYAIVEKVVFEPNEASPQRVQVWGAFAVARQNNPNDYEPAQRGYMYYTLTPGKEELSKREWNDLKSVAGTGQPVAYGVRWSAKDRLRKPSDQPASPDAYTIGSGVVKIGSQHRLFNELKEAVRPE